MRFFSVINAEKPDINTLFFFGPEIFKLTNRIIVPNLLNYCFLFLFQYFSWYIDAMTSHLIFSEKLDYGIDVLHNGSSVW